MSLERAQYLMQLALEDPEAPEPMEFEDRKRQMIIGAATDEKADSEGLLGMVPNDPLGIGKPGSKVWHYDFYIRPSDRDLLKADIFLSEIIEDYFLTEEETPRKPDGMYTCIS